MLYALLRVVYIVLCRVFLIKSELSVSQPNGLAWDLLKGLIKIQVFLINVALLISICISTKKIG